MQTTVARKRLTPLLLKNWSRYIYIFSGAEIEGYVGRCYVIVKSQSSRVLQVLSGLNSVDTDWSAFNYYRSKTTH